MHAKPHPPRLPISSGHSAAHYLPGASSPCKHKRVAETLFCAGASAETHPSLLRRAPAGAAGGPLVLLEPGPGRCLDARGETFARLESVSAIGQPAESPPLNVSWGRRRRKRDLLLRGVLLWVPCLMLRCCLLRAPTLYQVLYRLARPTSPRCWPVLCVLRTGTAIVNAPQGPIHPAASPVFF